MTEVQLHELLIAEAIMIIGSVGLVAIQIYFLIRNLHKALNSRVDAYVESKREGYIAEGRDKGIREERARPRDVPLA